MEEDVIGVLTASAAVTAFSPSVNWGEHPQGGAYPAIVLNVIDNAPGLTHQGGDGFYQGRVQVDCYARTFTEARNLSLAVSDALHGYRGDGLRLAIHVATRSSREVAASEADRLFRFGLDFLTHWRTT